MSNFVLSSTAFENEATIPIKYTCKGENISPDLSWQGIPEDTKSLVLIMDDPDAPIGTFVHWVLYNIPASLTDLPAFMPENEIIKDVGVQGKSSLGQIGYTGPCPPPGPAHRYYFKLYALNTAPDLPTGLNKASLMRIIEKHIIKETFLMGRFKR